MHTQRPSFHNILESILEDERLVLEIPSKDAATHPLASSLGAALEAGKKMYTDLQTFYTSSDSTSPNTLLPIDSPPPVHTNEQVQKYENVSLNRAPKYQNVTIKNEKTAGKYRNVDIGDTSRTMDSRNAQDLESNYYLIESEDAFSELPLSRSDIAGTVQSPQPNGVDKNTREYFRINSDHMEV